MKTLFDLAQVITRIPHPFINSSLTELGIITDIDLEDEIVSLVFAWPFPDIPIRDQLIASTEEVVKEMGFKLEFTERIMTTAEKNDFLIIEKRNWKN